ncbi:PPM-type phosphatase domain-containing protein [Aphelenchoides fujianensis]|nr:PPM-type phosphatase domain-containing protein [Aphelenchoides fujianensis]
MSAPLARPPTAARRGRVETTPHVEYRTIMSDTGTRGDETAALRELVQSEWANVDESQQNVIVQGISPPPLLKELLPAVPGPSGQLPPGVLPEPEESPVIRRFKAPFDTTTSHDARGDAISVCYDHLIQKRVPVWAAHLLAYQFVDLPEIKEKFQLESRPFDAHGEPICRLRMVPRFDPTVRAVHEVGCQRRGRTAPKAGRMRSLALLLRGIQEPQAEDGGDRHVVLPSFACIEPASNHGRQEDAFFAAFDGHNGHEVAAYLASHFHRAFLEPETQDEDVMEHLLKTYKFVDERLNFRCEKSRFRGGSTAAGVLIRGMRLLNFWCGDASIGVLNKDVVKTISKPHVPSSKQEYERVVAAGGTIVNVAGDLRVNGVLNITRSMGDMGAKPIITSEPETDTYDLSDDDWLLFVSSDGVWDELEPAEILDDCIAFARKYEVEDHVHLSDFIVADCRKKGRA